MSLPPAAEKGLLKTEAAAAATTTASPWTRAAGSSGGEHALPQNIAHRGFRARCPENTLAAFRAALAGGDDDSDSGGGHASALETDVHLTRDKVVVLSHDATLRRCFGRPERIADCDWAFLSTLRTVSNGDGGDDTQGEPMARLSDLLALLAEPGREAVWVLLDIKRDDDPAELLQCIADTIQAAPVTATAPPWSARVLLGCWDERAMCASRAALPAFSLAYIGVSLAMAYALLLCDDGDGDGDHEDDDKKALVAGGNPRRPPTVACFNLLQGILVGGRGRRFLRAAHARGRTVLVWTVNAPEWMAWSVRAGVDGVITDNPAAFDAVLRRGANSGDTGRLPHPPTARSVTGLFLRRWAWLGFLVGVARAAELAVTGLTRLRWGLEAARVRRALKTGPP